MEKWEDRKWEEMKNWEDIRDFNFSLLCLVESGKVEEWKNKFE